MMGTGVAYPFFHKRFSMKTLLFAFALVPAIALGACKVDQGVRTGPFEQQCLADKGTVTRVSPNEYTCTLPDGTVRKSTDKK